jgi:hypothetical protein
MLPPEEQKRNIFAFFRGKMEIHPKNYSGRMYSRSEFLHPSLNLSWRGVRDMKGWFCGYECFLPKFAR